MFRVERKFRPFFVLALILGLLTAKVWFLRVNFQRVVNQEAWVAHSNHVVSELDLALSSAKDAETSVRGYLLTGREDHLEPYNQGVRTSLDHINRVIKLTLDNPELQSSAQSIEQSLLRRFALLEHLKAQFVQNGGKLNRENLNFGEGKAIMDMIRAKTEVVKARELELLKQRALAAEDSKNLFELVLYASNVLLAVVLLIAFIMISKNIAQSVAESRQKSLISTFAKTLAGNHDLDSAASSVMERLSREFDVLAGALYVLDRGQLTPVTSLGLADADLRAHSKRNTFLDMAMQRSEAWQINEVPPDYWQIKSALGARVPSSLSFLPITFQGMNIGLIEMGTFKPLDKIAMKLLTLLPESIGIGLNAAQSRTKLQSLLETTQQQAEELQAQQEELKSSNEELEQQARALESQQQALNLKNRELESSQSQLELRAQDLQRLNQYKSEFLAKMSHELRTPLNGLLILSTLLTENKEKNLSEQQLQFAKSINNAGNDLLLLINDILDLSKIEARKLTLKSEDFTLSEVFASTRRTFEPQVDSKSLNFLTELPVELRDFTLHTDRQRLDQVLRNFISNAIKFTETGSITLAAERSRQDGFISISVKDTGIGIPDNKKEVIFEAFEQADSTVSRQYGGTGLGLTISRELAHLLGGSISLDSREGEGSTFSILIPPRLPRKASPANDFKTQSSVTSLPPSIVNPPPSASSPSHVQRGVDEALLHIRSDKTILIVEDDEPFRLSVVEAAKSYGFEVIEAADGEVALGILKSHIPSAILLDIKLPGISGLGILEMIKQMPHLRHIPVHMISALDHQQSALRMGALGYLTKPVTIDKVRSALGRIEKVLSSRVRRVLLIEDDETQIMAVLNLISGSDIDAVSSRTGKAALQQLKTGSFDCVILDLKLPDTTGFDLLKEFKKLEISLPPIVFYTGKDLSPEEDQYLRTFSESIVIKGARSPERLLDEVNLFLHRVESLLPEATRELLTSLRSQEKTFEGKTVLVVDDDIRNVFALTSALEAKGLKVDVARNGIEALDAVESKPNIDLVLMDIMMPKMDGFEATRKIRKSQNPHVKNLPIIALTAKAMKEDHERCIEAGASDYLPKPVNLDNLTTVLKVWLTPKGLFS